MYQRILACIDDSPTSQRALRAALQLARRRGSAVRIVHVVEHPLSLGANADGDYGQHYLEAARAAADTVLEAALASASAAGIEAGTGVLDSGARLGDAVAAEAEAWKADLVVVGSHGRRGVSRALLGSGAAQVLRLAPVPVLVVRGPAADTAALDAEDPIRLDRILVPVDGSEPSNHAFAAALELARDAGGRLRILHVFDMLPFLAGFGEGATMIDGAMAQARGVVDAAVASASSAGVGAEGAVVEGPGRRLGEAVAEQVADFQADLVVVGTTGRRGASRLFLGSGAEEVIRLAPVPVLAVRLPAGRDAV